jgi:anti-sigma regulatory factor (Ser/Thr protein kinase)
MGVETKRIPIRSDVDIVEARVVTRALATRVGFSSTDQVLIATAVSEIARNIVEYALTGEILVASMDSGRKGVEIVAKDDGPGIADTTKALEEGFSTARGLGMGLPGARRLMDEFVITSKVGQGTVVRMRKWLQ